MGVSCSGPTALGDGVVGTSVAGLKGIVASFLAPGSVVGFAQSRLWSSHSEHFLGHEPLGKLHCRYLYVRKSYNRCNYTNSLLAASTFTAL